MAPAQKVVIRYLAPLLAQAVDLASQVTAETRMAVQGVRAVALHGQEQAALAIHHL
jgi:hypothetical protein